MGFFLGDIIDVFKEEAPLGQAMTGRRIGYGRSSEEKKKRRSRLNPAEGQLADAENARSMEAMEAPAPAPYGGIDVGALQQRVGSLEQFSQTLRPDYDPYRYRPSGGQVKPITET